MKLRNKDAMNPRKNIPQAQGAQPKLYQNLNQAHQSGLVQRKTPANHPQPANPSMRAPVPPSVNRPQSSPKVLQTKMAGGQPSPPDRNGGHAPVTLLTSHPRQASAAQRKMNATATTAGASKIGNKTPAAPAVYRPQPLPKVLQTKAAPENRLTAKLISRAPAAPPISPTRRLQISSGATQASANVAQAKTVDRLRPQTIRPAQPHSTKQAVVQPFMSNVVQAVKIYPNLHPGAVESVNPNEVFKLHSFADQFRLRKANNHGVYVPNQQYNFVRTREGEMLLHNRYRHPSIAEGQQVLYAGEVFFNNGKIKWWSNGSGHYQPDVEDATQASLPMDYFYSYQQIIKGEHLRKKE